MGRMKELGVELSGIPVGLLTEEIHRRLSTRKGKALIYRTVGGIVEVWPMPCKGKACGFKVVFLPD